jgi:hypothetical protein
VALQRFRQTVWFQVPVRAIGKQILNYTFWIA